MALSSDRISVRDQMIASAAGDRPIESAIADLGIRAIELQLDRDFSMPHFRVDGASLCLATDDGISVIRQKLNACRARVSAILLMTDFSAEPQAGQVAWTIRAARIAAQLGASAVRVDPLTKSKDLSSEKVRDNFLAGIRQVLRATADMSVAYGIENHGPLGNDPAFLDQIFAAVDDPRLGMTLDTGNFYWWGVPLEELYVLLERYAARAVHTHIKNINYPPELANIRRPIGLDYSKYCCPLDEGNIDLRRVIRILAGGGYRGDLCIENEMLDKLTQELRMRVLGRDVDALRQAISR